MDATSAVPAPNEQVLSGTSKVPPSLAGYPFLGTMAAWSDDSGKIWLAREKSVPPYKPQQADANWKTFETPAIAVSAEMDAVYLAWTDPQGAVHVASSIDGWASDMIVAGAIGGPALLATPGRVYVAFNDGSNMLQLVYLDRALKSVSGIGTNCAMFSRPTLAMSAGVLYALSGGSTDGKGDKTMRIYASSDGATTWSPVQTQATATFGPPAMAFVDGNFHLVWADGETLALCHAATSDLATFSATHYADGCHGGGPAIVGLPDGVIMGWTYGAPPTNPKAHHIAVARIPLEGGQADLQQAESVLSGGRARRAAVSQQKCDPIMEVYNPDTDECVPRASCWGACVLESFTTEGFFDPVSYGFCVLACKWHTS